jgi:hypothetical protein
VSSGGRAADTALLNSTASAATTAAAPAAATPHQIAMKPILGSLLAFCDAQREAKFQLFYAQKRSNIDRIGLYACLVQLFPGGWSYCHTYSTQYGHTGALALHHAHVVL